MVKKLLLALLVMALLAAGGYYYYTSQYKPTTLAAWDVIPEHALVVYETNGAVASFNQLLETQLWEGLAAVPGVAQTQTSLQWLDSVCGSNGTLNAAWGQQQLLVSMHKTQASNFNFLFVLPLQNSPQTSLLQTLLENLEGNRGLRFSSRNFQNERILEISDGKGGSFSFVRYGGHLVGSHSALLIEDVIRTVKTIPIAGFAAAHGKTFGAPLLPSTWGKLYLNGARLRDLASMFGPTMPKAMQSWLEHMGHSGVYELEVTDSQAILTGYAYAAPGKPQYISTFENQRAKPFSLASMVPNTAASLFHVSMSEPTAWLDSLARYQELHQPASHTSRNATAAEYGLPLDELGQYISGEIALSVIESQPLQTADRLLFLSTDNSEAGEQWLQELAAKVNRVTGDTAYQERYASTVIHQMPLREFPNLLFGAPFLGFEQCFYANLNGVLVMGNKVQAIKDLMGAIEQENTWGKRIDQAKFLEGLSQQASITYIYNTARGWNNLLPVLSPNWKNLLEEHPQTFRSLKQVAVQVNSQAGQYYSSMVLQYQKAADPLASNEGQYKQEVTVSFDTTLTTRPHLWRTPGTQQFNALVQDARHTLYCVAPSGEVLWKDSLGEPIVGPMHTIDYEDNATPDFFFITPTAVYVLNAEGKPHEGFPVASPSVNFLEHATPVDYDGRKNYRFWLADNRGNSYLLNNEGEPLKGWNPRTFKSPLGAAPFHLRVRTKDYMVAMPQNHGLQVLNRKAALQQGFPISTAEDLLNPIMVEPGTKADNTSLSTISIRGELVKVTPTGKELLRRQLFRPNAKSRFFLIPDGLKKGFMIARQDENNWSFLDNQGNLLFEKSYGTPGALQLQHYNFGVGQNLVIATDAINEFTYLYDLAGQLVNYRPLNSSFPIALIYYGRENKYLIYHSYQNTLRVTSFLPESIR